MAIGHLHAGVVQRSAGQTAVHAAAYAARARILDQRTGTVYDYSSKRADVMFSYIGLPQGAPDYLRDAAAFANALEARETRVNSQTARKFIMALPHELNAEQREWLVKDFGRENFTRKGLAYHVAIHRPHTHGDHRNVHAHWTVSTRVLENGVFTDKDRDSNRKEALIAWRDNWENLVNRHLERHGHEARISMQSLEAQGIDRTPQIHMGQGASALERKGQATERGEWLRGIANDNGQTEPLQDSDYHDRDQEDANWHDAVIDAAIEADEAAHRAKQHALRDPEYHDREQENAAWQEAVITAAIEADEEADRAKEQARKIEAAERKKQWLLRQIDRAEAKLGAMRADLQTLQIEERGNFYSKLHHEEQVLEESLLEHYGSHEAAFTDSIAALSRPKSLVTRLWTRFTGKAKDQEQRLQDARKSLLNLQARRDEQRQGLAARHREAEFKLLESQRAQWRQLENRPDFREVAELTASHRAWVLRDKSAEADLKVDIDSSGLVSGAFFAAVKNVAADRMERDIRSRDQPQLEH